MPAAVALAARDHYSPLGPSDAVPSEPVSVAVALADKIDTLTGFWAIDEKPTGSKDPYALRRAALGVIRLVVGNGVRGQLFTDLMVMRNAAWPHFRKQWDSFLTQRENVYTPALHHFAYTNPKENFTSLLELVRQENTRLSEEVRSGYAAIEELVGASCADLLAFLHDRLKVSLRDQGIRPDIIDACLAMPGNDDLTLLVKRATALSATLKTEDGANLLQGYKRAANILSQAEAKDGVEYSYGADIKFAETDEERALFAALDKAEAAITPAMAAEDFATAMTAMAALRQPIDAFFTAVQVNSDNPIIRRNRLNLLSRIRTICSGVADLNQVDG